MSWRWREGAPVEDRGPEAGVIAQEVAEVFPELVDEDPESGCLRVD